MFKKADGSEVWLRTPHCISYLVIEGVATFPSSKSQTDELLADNFPPLTAGISRCKTYTVPRFGDDACVLFCLQSNGRCAIILLGNQKVDENSSSRYHLNHKGFLGYPFQAIDYLVEKTDMKFAIQDIRTEISSKD